MEPQRASAERMRAARALAERLAERGAERVILFGSSCDPTRAGVDSEPGLDGVRFHRRLADLPELEALPFPVDLRVYTPEEWARVSQRAFFRHEVLAKGVVLYERPR